MRFDPCVSIFKSMKSDLEDEKPYWSYEDIGVFSLVLAALGPILHLFTRVHLLSRSELENPGLGLQFAVIVFLILALYLILKLRHRRPVFRPLGWVWPRTAYMIVAPLLGVLLAAGVAVYLRLHGQSMPTTPLVEIVALGLVLGPILEESFFRGCLLPVLAHSVGKVVAVVLSALLFALFHSPANLAHWA
jgi:membrane protease YdiL (CAAX protease family)